MKFFTSFLAIAYGSSSVIAAAASKCSADNCGRAVTGTNRGLAAQSSAKQGCSSYLRATVYPATVTSTTTTTVYPSTQTATTFITTTTVLQTTIIGTSKIVASTETDSFSQTVTVQGQAKRAAPQTTGTVKPSSVPAYASPCSGAVRYSSACSCFGVTPTTTTMPTPTFWSTVTLSATASTTLTSLVAYTSTISQTVTSLVTTTTSVTSTATATAAPALSNAYCANNVGVDGTLGYCTTNPCQNFHLRIEGASDTIYEGIIRSGPAYVTTPSGGTQLCNGMNNNANPSAAGTGITTIQSAASLCGFDFDGTFSSQFDDFFITSISSTAQTANQFWGILVDLTFTPTGGCETEPGTTSELLWAFDAFNVNYFLQANPPTATMSIGQTKTFTILGADGNGGSPVPISGATFGNRVSDANGNVAYVATVPGTYRLKATRSDSIRSAVVVITVT